MNRRWASFATNIALVLASIVVTLGVVALGAIYAVAGAS